MRERINTKTVAIIGRPNVGKSTLFNRLIGERRAIETPIPGTTRDRLFGDVAWQGKTFTLVDVAGVEFGTKNEIQKNMQEGVAAAIEQADLILFVVDWNDKSNEADKKVAAMLRRAKKETIIAVNKADNIDRIKESDAFNRLGNFKLVPVSAISGKNTGDLLDVIVKDLSKIKTGKKTARKEKALKLAIVGRPNVGKSTLINSIIGEKRAIVSSEAGTTRDIVTIDFKHKGTNIEILDTAGIRRRGKIVKDTVESFAYLRSFRALKECDIVIVVIDAEEGLVSADAGIVGQAVEWGKGIVLAVNKTDVWGEEQEKNMAKALGVFQTKLNFTPYLPVVFISAENKLNINYLLNQVLKAKESRETTLNQKDLNDVLNYVKESNAQFGNALSLKQKRTKPPVLELKILGKKIPHKTQIRYLENKIRDVSPLVGSPIFIDLFILSKRGRK